MNDSTLHYMTDECKGVTQRHRQRQTETAIERRKRKTMVKTKPLTLTGLMYVARARCLHCQSGDKEQRDRWLQELIHSFTTQGRVL